MLAVDVVGSTMAAADAERPRRLSREERDHPNLSPFHGIAAGSGRRATPHPGLFRIGTLSSTGGRVADSMSLAVGKRVRSGRKALGLTQDAFAAAGGFDRNFVGRVERGAQNLTLATLARLSHLLSITMAELVADVRVDDAAIAELDRSSKRRSG